MHAYCAGAKVTTPATVRRQRELLQHQGRVKHAGEAQRPVSTMSRRGPLPGEAYSQQVQQQQQPGQRSGHQNSDFGSQSTLDVAAAEGEVMHQTSNSWVRERGYMAYHRHTGSTSPERPVNSALPRNAQQARPDSAPSQPTGAARRRARARFAEAKFLDARFLPPPEATSSNAPSNKMAKALWNLESVRKVQDTNKTGSGADMNKRHKSPPNTTTAEVLLSSGESLVEAVGGGGVVRPSGKSRKQAREAFVLGEPVIGAQQACLLEGALLPHAFLERRQQPQLQQQHPEVASEAYDRGHNRGERGGDRAWRGTSFLTATNAAAEGPGVHEEEKDPLPRLRPSSADPLRGGHMKGRAAAAAAAAGYSGRAQSGRRPRSAVHAKLDRDVLLAANAYPDSSSRNTTSGVGARGPFECVPAEEPYLAYLQTRGRGHNPPMSLADHQHAQRDARAAAAAASQLRRAQAAAEAAAERVEEEERQRHAMAAANAANHDNDESSREAPLPVGYSLNGIPFARQESLATDLEQWHNLPPKAALLLVDRIALEAKAQAQLIEFAKDVDNLHLSATFGELGEQFAEGLAPEVVSERVALVDRMGAAVQAQERARLTLEAHFGAAVRGEPTPRAVQENEEGEGDGGDPGAISLEALTAVEADLMQLGEMSHGERDGAFSRLLDLTDQHCMTSSDAHLPQEPLRESA